MENLVIIVLVIILVLMLFRPCPKKQLQENYFNPMKIRGMEMGTYTVPAANARSASYSGRTVVHTIPFKHRFTTPPHVKLTPLNDPSDLMGHSVWAVVVENVTTSGFKVGINRVDDMATRGNTQGGWSKPFRIQYLAIESPAAHSAFSQSTS